MPKLKFEYKKVLSENLRYGNKKQREALLKWSNQKKFDGRKPTPDELTSECLRKSSPLFGLMKSDVKSAAMVYWRQTAQDIIRHINVVKVNIYTKEISKPVVAFLHIKREQCGRISEKNYVPADRIMENPLLRQNILERAHGDFLAWMQRYERYSEFLEEFSPVLDAYQKVCKSINQKPKKVKSKRIA